MRRRMHDEHGAALVLLALSITALVAVAGLALDGGRVYGERREMQNAADTAAMAGTRQLDQFLTGKTADASTIATAAKDTAEKNGADRTKVTCELVRFDRSSLGPCPTTATMDSAVKAVAAGVHVTTANTQPTFFMGVVGNKSFTANAAATAQIGRPGGKFIAPFLVCATAPGHVPPILVPDATAPNGYVINDGTKGYGATAIGATYDIYGNDIKLNGKDCGNDSASFRGNVCLDQNKCDLPSYEIPGDWDADTGNANGPTVRLVNAGNVCSTDYTVGCVLVLPLCPYGNGQTGAGFAMHCIDLGLFQVTSVANTDINAMFLGQAVINSGGIVGPADINGARIVALTDCDSC
jgi:Flp pilus assembly protein TadG